MIDFARARLNMVNAQLLTNGITETSLVDAYRTFPREAFVDDAQRAFVYRDEDVPLAGGKRFVLDPLVEARMIQAAIHEPAERALVLGASSLPAIALLASFIRTITVLEPDAEIARIAKKHLDAYPVHNVSVIETAYREGYEKGAPYDVIFVSGAMATVSPMLTDQLAEGGRLICVWREHDRAQGRIVIVKRGQGLETFVGADAGTPYLAGFEPARDFVF